MKKMLIAILFSLSTFAQQPFITLDYPVTNFTGEKQEIRDLFSSLWRKYKAYDHVHCYRRAHVLANQLKHKDILSGKAYVFFDGNMSSMTKWWYHVAPFVNYKNEAVVLDRGLFAGPTYLTEWLDASSNGKGCKRIYTYQEYLDEKGNYNRSCMYLLAPMYHYGPNTLREKMFEFDFADLSDSTFSIPKRHRKKYIYRYPIKEL